MEKLYLKQKVGGTTEKFAFFDEQQQEVYQGQQTSMSLPPRFGLVDCAQNKQVMTLVGTTFSLMPEFTLVEGLTNQAICRIKKKFTMGKPKVTIKTATGSYVVDGDFVKRDFKILDHDGRQLLKVEPEELPWGAVFAISIDRDLIAEHVAIGILIGMDCAHYSENKY